MLELNELIEQDGNCWVAYCARGLVNAALKNHLDAIADSARALQISTGSMSERNRTRTINRLALFSKQLAGNQTKLINRAAQSSRGAQVGRIAQIGKFLIDRNDIAKLENLVSNQTAKNPNIRRLTPEAVDHLNAMLDQMCREIPAVIGTCVFSRDGFLLASALPQSYKADMVGVLLLGSYLTGTEPKDLSASLGQLMIPSSEGYIILSDCDGDIVVTMTNEQDPIKLPELHQKIGDISGSR